MRAAVTSLERGRDDEHCQRTKAMEKTNHVTSHSHTARCFQVGMPLDTALGGEMFRLRFNMWFSPGLW